MLSTRTTTIAIRVSWEIREELENIRDEIGEDHDPMTDPPTLSSVSRHLLIQGMKIHREKNKGDGDKIGGDLIVGDGSKAIKNQDNGINEDLTAESGIKRNKNQKETKENGDQEETKENHHHLNAEDGQQEIHKKNTNGHLHAEGGEENRDHGGDREHLDAGR